MKHILLSLFFMMTFLFAAAPTERSVTKLYIATFDRAPDAAGLRYWLHSGLTLEAMAESFFAQPETQAKYPTGLSDEKFIFEVYSNLFNRTPDRAGLRYWLKELRNGHVTHFNFILAVVNGAHGKDKKVLDNKTKVGLAFARSGSNDVKKAYEIMKGVTADKRSMENALCAASLSGCPAYRAYPVPPPPPAPVDRPFITTWQTDNLGSSDDDQIKIGTQPGDYTYDYTVNWGDGTKDEGATGDITHTYENPGTYTVEISGDFPGIYFHTAAEGYDDYKLLSVEQWGTIKWETMFRAFFDCGNMIVNATDAPDLSRVTDMSYMFCCATSFNGDIEEWDVSNVTNMSHMFHSAYAFNQNLGAWDTSRVTDMQYMFSGVSVFNQDLSSWDTSSVTNMRYMFHEAHLFNGDISGWSTSNVIDMTAMFYTACTFNQPVGGWDTLKVESMESMFNMYYCSTRGFTNSFNQDISTWDTSLVENMHNMFYDNSTFKDHDLSEWDVNNVTNHIDFPHGWGTGNIQPIWP